MNQKQENTKINNIKMLGVFLLVFIFSAVVYVFSLSTLSFAAVYTYFMIRTLLITCTILKGSLDRNSVKAVAVVSLIILCVGYYFAYVYFYHPYLTYQGYTTSDVFLRLIPILHGLDPTLFPGVLFFISFAFVGGFAMNYQYIKNETKNEEQKEMLAFRKEIGLDTNSTIKEEYKKSIVLLLIVGCVSIGLGLWTDQRFENASYHELTKRYKTELKELKEKDEEAYNKAIEVLDNQKINYNYSSSEYYVRGNDNTFTFNAIFDSEDYVLYYLEDEHGVTSEIEWGEWDLYNGRYTLIDLHVKVENEGYMIIEITNSYNDEKMELFVDNFNYD